MADYMFTDDNFESEVLQSKLPVLVDFFATWCGPCMMLGPTVEKFAEAYEGKVKVGKVDVDASPELMQKYSIASVPTLIVFRDGEPVNRVMGVQSMSSLEKLIPV